MKVTNPLPFRGDTDIAGDKRDEYFGTEGLRVPRWKEREYSHSSLVHNLQLDTTYTYAYSYQ
jgi:hypothetical protein